MSLNDVHCHFLSRRCFEALGREKYGQDAVISLGGIASELGCDAPGETVALAKLWCAELDRQHVTRAALIASAPGDEDSVAVAVSEHPDRFVGFFMFNPAASESERHVERAFAELGLRCACLFPALHRYEL